MKTESEQLCPVCEQAVDSESLTTDPYGTVYHDFCYALRMDLMRSTSEHDA